MLPKDNNPCETTTAFRDSLGQQETNGNPSRQLNSNHGYAFDFILMGGLPSHGANESCIFLRVILPVRAFSLTG